MTLTGFTRRYTGIPSLFTVTGLLFFLVFSLATDVCKATTIELPEWIQNFKLKGDIRLRYQGQDSDPGDNERQRYRIRFRPGVSAEVTDKWSVDFGLATGGDDLRSTNQTYSEFSTYDIRLDYAYATYKPAESVELMIGKIKNPIWNPKDLIWDSDIRPDGGAAKLTFKPSDRFAWYLTPGFFSLGEYRESKGDEDFESMVVLQGGIDVDITGSTYFKLGATAHIFNDIVAGSFAESAGTNTMDIENAYSVETEVGFTGLPVFVGALGQYVVSDADEDETGYLIGLKVGNKSVKKLGQWQLKYNYRSLENNAFPDFLMDSDAFDGATGVEGSEFEVVIGLAKNVTFGIDYYMMEDKNRQCRPEPPSTRPCFKILTFMPHRVLRPQHHDAGPENLPQDTPAIFFV